MKKITFLTLVFCLVLTACKENDYLLYNTDQKDAVFFEYQDLSETVVDTLFYAFNFELTQTHDIVIPIKLMGMPADQDRQITLVAESGSTMKEGTNYTVGKTILPAGAVKTSVVVTLLRDKDPEIQSQAKILKLQLVEGDDLRSVGRTQFQIKYHDIRPTVAPAWWDMTYPMPTYSFQAAQLFFQYFYALKSRPELTDVMNELTTIYGEYFRNAKKEQGPLTMNGNFLINYVLIPLYNDHSTDLEWPKTPTFKY